VIVEPGTFKTEIFESNREIAAGARDPASPYAALTPDLEKKVDDMVERFGDDPQKVADAILNALTIRKPRLRYLVGRDAKMLTLVRRVGGFRLYAALIRAGLGLRSVRPLAT
jgi:hypothetical protein